MSTIDWAWRAQRAAVVIAVLLTVSALYLAKSAILPLVFAAFLAILLSPAVARLVRLRLPRALAAAVVVAALVAMVGLALNATWGPAREWLDKAPETMRTLERKLRPATRFIAKVESVSEQAGRVTDPGVQPAAATAPPPPLPSRKWTVAQTERWLVAVVTMLMVTYFLLASGPALLTQIESRLSARGASTRLLQAVATINADVGRYFAAVTLSNLLLGIGTAATMYWLDMPNPLLWGVIAFALNYIPYAGSATTLLLLTAVAVVSFDGLGVALGVAGCYLVLTTIEGQILQPVLVSRRLDVSPLVIILSLWFGGWLWGIAGMALAVPVVVTVKTLMLALEGSELATGAARSATRGTRVARLLATGAARMRSTGAGE